MTAALLVLALATSPPHALVPHLPVVSMGTPPAPAGVSHCCGGGGRVVNASCCDPALARKKRPVRQPVANERRGRKPHRDSTLLQRAHYPN